MSEYIETEGKLGNGVFGEVYYGKIKCNGQPVVIKYNQKDFINNGEFDVLRSLQAKQYANFPKIYMKGKVKDKPFLVCQRFGTTLHAIIEKHNGPFSH